MTETYAEACERATTDQGLDPIVAALTAAGVPAGVDQTGGFCMCASVYAADDRNEYLYITSGEQWNGGDGWLVCHYLGWNDEDEDDPRNNDEGVMVGENMTTTQVVAFATLFMVGRHCPVCRTHLFHVRDDNGGDLRFRCEPCDIEDCPDCGHWTTYDQQTEWWKHFDPKTPACFMHPVVDDA